MNTQLRRMMVEAEGRYLTDSEINRLREYATGMGLRLETARRVEEAEGRLLEAVAAGLPERVPGVARAEAAAVLGDLRVALRYATAAHVRQDGEFFRRNYVAWVAELQRSLLEPILWHQSTGLLLAAASALLDPLDARALQPWLELIHEEART